MATDLDRLIEQARSLTVDERRRLRVALDISGAKEESAPSPDTAEQVYKRRLQQIGLLKEVKTAALDSPSGPDRTPIAIAGEPLSQTLIEERR